MSWAPWTRWVLWASCLLAGWVLGARAFSPEPLAPDTTPPPDATPPPAPAPAPRADPWPEPPPCPDTSALEERLRFVETLCAARLAEAIGVRIPFDAHIPEEVHPDAVAAQVREALARCPALEDMQVELECEEYPCRMTAQRPGTEGMFDLLHAFEDCEVWTLPSWNWSGSPSSDPNTGEPIASASWAVLAPGHSGAQGPTNRQKRWHYRSTQRSLELLFDAED